LLPVARQNEMAGRRQTNLVGSIGVRSPDSRKHISKLLKMLKSKHVTTAAG
jgi:hypothetical protein